MLLHSVPKGWLTVISMARNFDCLVGVLLGKVVPVSAGVAAIRFVGVVSSPVSGPARRFRLAAAVGGEQIGDGLAESSGCARRLSSCSPMYVGAEWLPDAISVLPALCWMARCALLTQRCPVASSVLMVQRQTFTGAEHVAHLCVKMFLCDLHAQQWNR
jgi:hypothetical protein